VSPNITLKRRARGSYSAVAAASRRPITSNGACGARRLRCGFGEERISARKWDSFSLPPRSAATFV
jgi:hypothetical protein